MDGIDEENRSRDPLDPVGWRYTKRDRPVKSLDGKFKQKKKEKREREMKEGWRRSFPPSLRPSLFLFYF
jgi:hypothetical protein